MSVCVCICLSVRQDICGTTRAIFTKFFLIVHVAYVRGSVLLWHVCDTPHRRAGKEFLFPIEKVGVIFRPYGRKFTVRFRYIFRPYKHWFSRWRHIIAQSTSTNHLNQTDPNANPNPNPNPKPNPTKA